jgi:hypothetical protein
LIHSPCFVTLSRYPPGIHYLEENDTSTLPVMSNNILSLLPVATVILIISDALLLAGTNDPAQVQQPTEKFAVTLLYTDFSHEQHLVTGSGNSVLGGLQ